jgi:hypothetical protein
MPILYGSHQTYWTGARDEHIFAHHVEGEGGVCRVAKGIEAGENIEWDILSALPDVGGWDAYIFGKCT